MEPVFKALLVRKDQSGQFKKGIIEITLSDLPTNDLLIKVKVVLSEAGLISAFGSR